MVFYQSIKAETEFLVVLNQLSKGTVIALVLYYFTDLNFPVRFKRIVLQSVPLPVPRRRLVSSSSPGTTAH
jgi:hypothetical protein